VAAETPSPVPWETWRTSKVEIRGPRGPAGDGSPDPALLERVLVNLIANAVRHNPPGEPVLVTASAHADRLELRVIDRGPGIRLQTVTASSNRSSGSATATNDPGSASGWRCRAA